MIANLSEYYFLNPCPSQNAIGSSSSFALIIHIHYIDTLCAITLNERIPTTTQENLRPSLSTLFSPNNFTNKEKQKQNRICGAPTFPYQLPRITYFPTKFSSTELFPADWPPTTAICGRSSCMCTPSDVNASCSLLTMGINASMPTLVVDMTVSD